VGEPISGQFTENRVKEVNRSETEKMREKNYLMSAVYKI